MIQVNKEYLNNERYVSDLVGRVKKVLKHRAYLRERYERKLDKEIKTPLEYYISNIATGYFAGKEPVYTVKQETDKNKIEIIKKYLEKEVGKNANQEEMQMLLDYIKDYNDNGSFFYDIVFDYMTTNACYWTIYETEQNEIVYTPLSSLQAVALYDYSTPVQKLGGMRIWQETDEKGENYDMVEIITSEEKRYYKNARKTDEYKEDESMRMDVKWELVPFNAVENPDGLSIFEPVITLIDAYERVVENNKHTFEYNDEAKLKITGFTPENPLLIQDENGRLIKNPNRVKEDEAILNAPTFYTPDNTGDIAWIIKDINDTAVENHKKTLIELILMLAMVPNLQEISTGDKTATEIERSFFSLEQVLTRADKLFKKELLAMWENIFARINVKKGTDFDFREIQIELPRNLPQDKVSMISMAMQLREILSDETVLRMLPFDFDIESELAKKKEESETDFEQNLEMVKAQKGKDSEEVDEDVEGIEQTRE